MLVESMDGEAVYTEGQLYSSDSCPPQALCTGSFIYQQCHCTCCILAYLSYLTLTFIREACPDSPDEAQSSYQVLMVLNTLQFCIHFILSLEAVSSTEL